MLLVTEFDPALEVEKKLPPSLVRKLYLTGGTNPLMNTTPTMFGNPIHFIYLGYELRSVETFVKSIPKGSHNIILISPISRWGLYCVKLKTVAGLEISNQFDSRESKIELVQTLTGLGKKKSAEALSILKYNFVLLEKNIDLLKWCAQTGDDIETALASVEYYSYTDILFYLCGSKNHTKEKFIRTLAKYRYGKKQILKYLKNTLDEYVKFRLDGETPSRESSYTVTKLSSFLYLDDAMTLRYSLDHVKTLPELLKGEL